MDPRTGKLKIMHYTLHSRIDVDRLCAKKKEGKGLDSIVDNVNASIQRLEDDIKKARRMTDFSHQKKKKKLLTTQASTEQK